MRHRTLRRTLVAGVLALLLLSPLAPVQGQLIDLFVRHNDDFQDRNLDEYEHIAGSASDWSMPQGGWPGGIHARTDHVGSGESLIVLDPDEYCFGEDRWFRMHFKLDTSNVLQNAVFVFGPANELWRVEVHKDREVKGYQTDEVRIIHPDGGVVASKQDPNLFDATKHHVLRIDWDQDIDVRLDGTPVTGFNPVREVGPGTFGFGVRGSSSPFHTNYPVATEFDNLRIEAFDLLGNSCLQEELVNTEVVEID